MHGLASVSTLAASLALALPVVAAPAPQQLPDPLPRPDGKKADTSKPVHVYILMGQSNMLGFGKVPGLKDACANKGLYPYLMEEDGSWTVRKDVRYVRVMCSGPGPRKIYNNEWMTVKGNFGPEHGIGHYVGHVTKAPVLILKSCIGNRSLGWDLLPPTAEGYGGNKKGPREPISGDWYAGMQYDGDVRAAKEVLEQIGKYYPGASRYEVKGFFFWQGDKDFRNAEHAAAYEKNLLCLIESLRMDFKAPKAKFVCATLGQTRKGAGGPQGKILEAQLNIDGAKGKYKKHKGMVASVYSHPLSKGGSSSGHYGGNPETYMNVGQAMGMAMAKLIMNSPEGIPGVDIDELSGPLKGAYKNIVAGKLGRAEKTLREFLDSGSNDGDQMVAALKLTEHLSGLVDSFVKSMEDALDEGDLCRLRDGLKDRGKDFEGVPAFDKRRADWTAALTSEGAATELEAGDEFARLVARKEGASPGEYCSWMATFQQTYPDSFYAAKAEAEISPTRTALREAMQKIAAFGDAGDLYAKHKLIAESEAIYAKMPEFDAANEQWAAEAKDPDVKQALAAGAAYSDIFEDAEALGVKLEDSLKKNKRISKQDKRDKADAKAMSKFQKGLVSLGKKLERIAKRYGGTYYGDAASRSYKAFVDSGEQVLQDLR